ncbi:MAG: alpha/beta hydrolase [Steroidobacteraceae bacterium]
MNDTTAIQPDLLDPEIRRFVDGLNEGYAKFPDFGRLPLAERRRAAEQVRTPWRSGGPRMHRSEELHIAGRRARVHVPSETGNLPALLYLHGGGWVMFSIDTHDRLMREYAARAGIVVIGLDYSLAPEVRFPVALDEAVAAVDWMSRAGQAHGIDPKRLALGGDSAGANLATGAALRLRDRGDTPLRALLLNYGVYSPEPTPSYDLYDGPRYMLNVEEMRYFWESYVRHPSDLRNPLAAPLLADLAGLPPALLSVGNCDILADSNRAMAAKLEAAGVPTELRVYEGASHSFLEAMSISTLANGALDDAAHWLRARLAPR